MTTLGQLVEQTRHALSGFDRNSETVTALTQAIDATTTTILVEEARGTGSGPVAARGLAEIDFELVRVKSTDGTGGTLELFPFGRGYRGTTATTHLEGSEVRFNPAWPASTVAQHVNGVLREVYPSVYAVKTHDTTVPSDGGSIDVPDDAVGLLSVWVEDPLRPTEKLREVRWDYRPHATDTGRSLRIGGHHRTGTSVRVVYSAQPGVFDLTGALTQDFETVTGLPERCSDLIQLGVASRLAPFIDVSKLPYLAAAARDAGEAKAPGQGATQARLLQALFRQRVEQEAAVLAKEHPIRLHMVGVK